MKRVSVVAIFRFNHALGDYELLTNKRSVINKKYDPLYDDTWELVGETLQPDETFQEAAIRGVQEETGSPNLALNLYSWNPFDQIWVHEKTKYPIDGIMSLVTESPKVASYTEHTTGRGDKTLLYAGAMILKQVGPPQPWMGPCFLGFTADDFKPNLDQAGEVSGHRWWTLEELRGCIHDSREFMGFHCPFIKHLVAYGGARKWVQNLRTWNFKCDSY